MNILFISHGLYPCKIGGAEIFNYHLIRELSKLHKIFVVTSCRKESDIDATFIRVDPRRFGLRRISYPLQDFVNIARLCKKIDLFHISYMHADSLHWLPYPLAKKIYGIPYVISIHGGGMHKWKRRFAHELLFKNADAIIAVSERIKEEYEKRSGRPIRFIPPLLPFKRCDVKRPVLRQRLGFTDSDEVIFYIGSLRKIKGCDLLLDSFMSLGKEYIEKNRLRLLFVGDGEMRAGLEQRSIDLGLTGSVRFLGSVKQEDIPSIYAMGDIYVIPSLFEGTSISMLEAMFNRKPIIGSRAGGIKEIIRDNENGLLFDPGDHRDLAQKISYLVENKGLHKDISSEAKKTFDDNFHFDSVVSGYTEVFNKACKSRR